MTILFFPPETRLPGSICGPKSCSATGSSFFDDPLLGMEGNDIRLPVFSDLDFFDALDFLGALFFVFDVLLHLVLAHCE